MSHLETKLKHHDLTEKTIGVFFDVYNQLGHQPEFRRLAFRNERKKFRMNPRASAAGTL